MEKYFARMMGRDGIVRRWSVMDDTFSGTATELKMTGNGIVIRVIEMPIIKNSKGNRIFHEHEFYFEDNGEEYHGIIDLFIEYPDHIDIIDYKLSNMDSEEYKRQLSIYKMYIAARSNKPINCYLLSLINQEIKKIEL